VSDINTLKHLILHEQSGLGPVLEKRYLVFSLKNY